MKISQLLTVLAVVSAPAVAGAQMPGHSFGLGLQAGTPGFGFAGKYWLDSDDALQGVLGWNGAYYAAPGPLVTFDWTRRIARISPRTPHVRFGFDVGVGGALGYVNSGCYHDVVGRYYCYDQDAVLAARVPLSFAAWFPKPRVEAYVELTPALRLLPTVGPMMMGAVGGRFYF